jgi:hypothetical protein
MTPEQLKTVRKGQAIKAEDHNGIIALLRSWFRLRLGPGLTGKWTSGGLSLNLSHTEREWILPGRILSKTGGDPDIGANIRYTVGAIGRYHYRPPFADPQGLVLVDVLPSFGRPYKGAEAAVAKIRPAAVGAMCLILLDKDEEDASVGKLALLPGGEDGETPYAGVCE